MTDAAPRRPGRPAHVPTETTRALVIGMVNRDASLADIAAALGLSQPTVRLHYADELLEPRPQLNFSFVRDALGKIVRQPNPRMGRPEHVPTDESRERVEILVAGGMRQWQIAAALGISVPTLALHYDTELLHGRSRRKAVILESLYRTGAAGNVTAQKAWLALPEDLEDAPSGDPKTAPMGKKEQAMAAALTAAANTDWTGVLPN